MDVRVMNKASLSMRECNFQMSNIHPRCFTCQQRSFQWASSHSNIGMHRRFKASWRPASGLCFDAACQETQDRAFLLSISIPILVGGALILGRRLQDSKGQKDAAEVDENFEVDVKNELVFKPISYTPWPVPKGSGGVLLRIEIGPINDLAKQTFAFDPSSPHSDILAVTLPRPLGIVFGEEKKAQRVVVEEILTGSPAHQRLQVAKINPGKRSEAVLEGDILRACTCTNFVYPTNALFGAQPPKRTRVLYGCDNQKWPEVINALKRGEKADGDVTLVLERFS